MLALRTGLLAIGLVALSGCGKDPEILYNVSGAVNYDGKPVPVGMVFFDPEGGGTQGYAPIAEGRFDTGNGKGAAGGNYKIRVMGFNGKSTKDNPRGTPLFTDYSFTKELPKSDSELTIEVPKKR